jgi:hypothetical protein
MAVFPSHFEYLDDEDLELKPLFVSGADQEIEIWLPRSLAEEIPESTFIEPDGLELPYLRILKFPYEWQWGGPGRKGTGLYLFEFGIERLTDGALLSKSIDERTKIHRKGYEAMDEGKWREIVLKNLKIVEYESNQGIHWLLENLPTVMQHHEVFSVPISDEHELIVWFWYNEDWVKDHPEWYERRKALSRRILDSVRLSDPGVLWGRYSAYLPHHAKCLYPRSG